MRIVLANSFYPPRAVGGAERSVEVLANALEVEGHEVVVFSCDGWGLEAHEEPPGARIVRMHARWFGPDLYKSGGDKVTRDWNERNWSQE